MSIEFAVMGPVILLVLAILWQAVLVGYTFVLAGNAADKVARVCAVDGDWDAAGREDLGSWEGDLGCAQGGGLANASAAVRAPLLFPGGPTIDITVDAESAAALEQAP
ncbi:pilus assembly protein [Streptomyces sp. NPDC060194]|uniref:pilus assembly protein n=1 Tax=Streptomyces sp. NPDC060194 TaxID=3347069 RepID=UPI00364B9515